MISQILIDGRRYSIPAPNFTMGYSVQAVSPDLFRLTFYRKIKGVSHSEMLARMTQVPGYVSIEAYSTDPIGPKNTGVEESEATCMVAIEWRDGNLTIVPAKDEKEGELWLTLRALEKIAG